MALRNLNKLTRANLLAHIQVNAAVDDIRVLYGQAGVTMAAVLIAEGLVSINSRGGTDTFNLTAAGRAVYSGAA